MTAHPYIYDRAIRLVSLHYFAFTTDIVHGESPAQKYDAEIYKLLVGNYSKTGFNILNSYDLV